MSAVLGPGEFTTGRRDRAIRVAVAASVVLHGILLFSSNLLNRPKAEIVAPGPIVARLMPARAETSLAPPLEPAAAVQPPPPPASAKPAAPPPAVSSRVPAESRAAPKPAEPEPVSTPAAAPANAAPQPGAPSATPLPAAAPAPSAATQKLAKADPQPVVRPGSAPNTPAPEDAGTVERYRMDIINAATRYKTNPRVPGMREIKETTAVVRMQIGANGLIASIAVQKSAGHEILDKNSVETLRKAKPLVQIPTALRGKEFAIDVPFIYQLKDEGA